MSVCTLILDDELDAINRIKNLLNQIDQVTKIITTDDEDEALKKIVLHQPDIIFLDFELNYSTGFDLLEKIPNRENFTFIMTTGYDEHALKAFKYSIFDYLLKPFSDSEFYVSVEKAITKTQNRPKMNYIGTNKLAIKQTGKIVFLEINEINYIKSSGDYVEIYIDNNKYLVRHSISKLYEKLDANTFCRIHRSTIVNLNHVNQVLFSDFGELDVTVKGEKIRVSRTYKQELLGMMGI